MAHEEGGQGRQGAKGKRARKGEKALRHRAHARVSSVRNRRSPWRGASASVPAMRRIRLGPARVSVASAGSEAAGRRSGGARRGGHDGSGSQAWEEPGVRRSAG
jgi:hypothetical protein